MKTIEILNMKNCDFDSESESEYIQLCCVLNFNDEYDEFIA